MNNVLFIRDTIYKLKQDYGQRMDLYITSKSDVDFSTGIQTVAKRRIVIPKVILLSEIMQRRIIHDIAMLTAGRNFAYGGLFDEGMRTIIIGGTDLPKGITPDSSDYFIWENRKYTIEKFEELEHGCAYIIKMKQVDTQTLYQVLEFKLESRFEWTQLVVQDD